MILGESPIRAFTLSLGVMRGSLDDVWASNLYNPVVWDGAELVNAVDEGLIRSEERSKKSGTSATLFTDASG